jgi:ribosomal-protein-serine acetyltransferase
VSFGLGIILETPRLLIRPPREDDAKDVFAGVDDQVRRWMPWAQYDYTVEDALDWCTRLAHSDPDRTAIFVIEAEDRFAGSIGLTRANWVDGRVEIGYWLASWARGKGYAQEAVRGLSAYAFARGLHRVELLAATDNHESQRVAERSGFTREGVLREAELHARGRVDMVMYGLLERELE